MPGHADPIEAVIRQTFTLQRLNNAIARDSSGILRSLFDDIAAEIARIDPTGPAALRYRRMRVAKLIARVEEMTGEAFTEWNRAVRGDLARLGRAHGLQTTADLVATLGVAGAMVNAAAPTQNMVKAIIDTNPFQGETLAGWAKVQKAGTVRRVRQVVQRGMMEERSIDWMTRQIRGGAGVRGVWQTTRREAEAIVRTAVTEIASQAQLFTYQQNPRVVKSVEVVATLDNLTCFAAGTGVLTPSGYVPIENITVGSVVIGGSRRSRRVVGVRVAQRSGMARVALSNGIVVECTADHRWLTAGGCWVEARDLQPLQHLSSNSDLCHVTRYEDLPDLQHDVRSEAVEGEQVLRAAVLPGRAAARGLQRDPRPEGSVRELWDSSRANEQAGRPALLLKRVLPGRSHETVRVGLRGMRESGDGHRRSGEGPAVLLPCVQGGASSAQAHQLPRVRGPVYADSVSERQGRYCQSLDVLPRVPVHMDEDGRRSQAEDRGCVPRREASELDGWQVGSEQLEPSRAQLVEDRAEGTQAGRGQMPALRRSQGPRWQRASRSPHYPVPQFRNGQEGQSHVEPSDALPLMPHDGGVEDSHQADRPSSQDPVRVEAVELYEYPTLVYDIQVDVDESFIVADAVVHNCPICQALDGKIMDAANPTDVPAFHIRCRCGLMPVVDWEGLGLKPPEQGERFARDQDARLRGESMSKQRTQVPGDTTYETWLRDQKPAVVRDILGPGRAKLFTDRKMRLDRMISTDRRILTLSELEAKL